MRTLIAGGGTGGHLTPALAVAQALRRADPAGDVLIVGRRRGVAERLVTGTGLRLATLDIGGLDVRSPLSLGRATYQLPVATAAAVRLLRGWRADVVVGAAGYVCVPVVMAASLARIPVLLLEQNARPGRAVRLLARRARVVASSFAETSTHLPRVRVVHTGNPIRAGIRERAPGPVRDRCRHLLVMGGSQGARRLNQAVTGCIEELLAEDGELAVTHQTGSLDEASARAFARRMPEPLRGRYHVHSFLDDVGAALAAADLVLMRAGGSSLAECSAMGRPMILVPYPHVRGHQAYNALPYERGGAAILVSDQECTPVRVLRELTAVLRDTQRWRRMQAASVAMSRPDAADRVVDLIAEIARPGPGLEAAA